MSAGHDSPGGANHTDAGGSVTAASRRSPRTRHAIAFLLRFYPRAFRERFGEEIAGAYLQSYQHAGGSCRRVRFWLRALTDALIAGTMERLAGTGGGGPPTDRRKGRWLEGFRQDLRFATRSLRHRPGLVAVVAITLAVGIGASAAVFVLLDALLLRPVTVERPDELLAVGLGAADATRLESRMGALSYPDFVDLRSATRSFSGLTAYGSMQLGLVTAGATARASAAVVSGEYFAVLGLRPQLGRLLDRADATSAGTAPVVVLSDALWDRAFARDTAAIGRTIELNRVPFTVVGVAPRGFRGSALYSPFDLWIPITMVRAVGAGGLFSQDVLAARVFPWLSVLGRLRPGVTAERAQAELTTLYDGIQSAARNADLASTVSRQSNRIVSTTPFTQAATLYGREDLLHLMGLFAAVVAMTLAIACVNVANVLLVRSAERARELAIRLALGVTRARLMRQLVLESVLLALAGGGAGVAVGWVLLRIVRSFSVARISLAGLDLQLDARMLGATLAISLLAALACGIAPAMFGSRRDVLERLRDARRDDRTSSGRPRGGLVFAQVMLTMVLLTGAGLFLRSLRSALSVELGFDPRPVAAVTFGLRQHGYSEVPAARSFLREALRRVRAQPGIEAAGLAQYVPVSGAAMYVRPHLADGASAPTDARVAVNPVSAGYFESMRIPLVAGRVFQDSDDERGAAVVIVTRAAADALWPGRNPLGRTLQLMQGVGEPAAVVGVVEDGHYGDLRDRRVPYLFVPAVQFPGLGVLDHISVVARGTGDARAALHVLRRELAALDPKLPLFEERRVADQLDVVLMPQRFGATLLTWFAAAALLIAGVGVYGVVAYSVALRRREIGIRRALGAPSRDVARVVAHSSAAWTLAGIIAGTAGAAVSTRLTVRFLFDVTPLDAWSFAGAALLLILAAAIAVAMALTRALRVQPLETLRS